MKPRLLILFALFSLTASAEKIPQDKAREMALEFFSRSPKGRSVTRLSMINDGLTAQGRSAGDAPPLYVFDNPDGKGFVVMAGDDAVMPVLGYSFDNEFPEGPLPPNLQGWMNGIKRQVEFARSTGMSAPAGGSRADVEGDVVVKLETAKWDQTTPYNDECPVIGSRHAVSGCTATSTAIVMRYHQWPQAGKGTVPGYTTPTQNIPVPSRTLGEEYQWDLMPLEYRPGEYSEEEAAQVARLIADVGAMLEMNYTSGESGALTENVVTGLSKYMDYDKSMLMAYRDSYMTDEWYEMMKRELDEKRPVIYSGFDDEAGHQFVLDGYTTDDYFSVNWGWSGDSDGYFRLDALYPYAQGTGGNNTHFNFNQDAVLGIKKNEGGDYVAVNIQIVGKGFISYPKTFEQNVPFEVVVSRISNVSVIPFTGVFRLALTDKAGNLKQVLQEYDIVDLPYPYGYEDLLFEGTITVPIETGYRIRLFYKASDALEWTLLKGGEKCQWEILVGDEFSVEETTVLKYDKQTRKITLTLKDDVEVTFLKPDGTALADGVEVKGNAVTITTWTLPAGTYTLKLVKGNDRKEVKIKLGAAQGQE